MAINLAVEYCIELLCDSVMQLLGMLRWYSRMIEHKSTISLLTPAIPIYSRFAQSTHTSHYLTHHSTQTLHSPLFIYTYTTLHHRTGLPSLLPHEDEIEEQANKSEHHSHPSKCWHDRKQDDINQEYLLSWYAVWIQWKGGGMHAGRESEVGKRRRRYEREGRGQT